MSLGFALLGVGILLVLTVGLDLATDQLEQKVLEDTLATELAETQEDSHQEPTKPMPETHTIRSYSIPGSDPDLVPSALRDLTPGFHTVTIDSKEYAVAVSQEDERPDFPQRRFFALYDKTSLARREDRLHIFLGIGILIMGLISAVGGRWLATRVIAPVTELARRVAALPPGVRAGNLAQHFADDDLGDLAQAVDEYTERLADAMEREQAFTGDVSHELRNPLTVVQGAVDVLRETPGLPDSARRPLDRIARATVLMDELTDTLLSLARTAGSAPAEPNQFEVADLARELIDSYREVLRGTPVSLELRVEGQLIATGARAAMRMLLGNLIRNACFHTRLGHVRVTIDSRGVAVEDTGVGINPADLKRVVERGYRHPGSPGAGIGLSLTRRLCERNGWRFRLESERGRGTRAWVGLGDPVLAGAGNPGP